MSGLKLAALYGLIPNTLGFCGPQKLKQQKILKNFLLNKASSNQARNILKQFEAASAYYRLIAKSNQIKNIFDARVVEAYWIGNNLLDKVKIKDLRQLIAKQFSRPGLLSKDEAARKAQKIPVNSKPHHSFHVMVLGSITGRVDFNKKTELKDTCRVGWGRVEKKLKAKNKKLKIVVNFQPLTGINKIKIGAPKEKILIWDKKLLPELKEGNWISFHWDHALQILTPENIANLKKYTQNTLKTLSL